jgi:UPF0716 protein FxsA
MRLIILLLIIAFPIAEIWTLISLAQAYGWWLLVYLVVIGFLGLQLIRQEKMLFSARMMQNLRQGGNPIKAMFGSARTIIAGLLLMIPGVITDAIAVVLLLMPAVKSPPNADGQAQQTHYDFNNDIQQKAHRRSQNAANDDVIEGEFKREDD